ncbi:hypothetical protein C8R44DRAFT_787645 [Mycena epipterygia]|nr:hypothetical protein C8R44DRAFT_787645 [Mycena epipterygia]
MPETLSIAVCISEGVKLESKSALGQKFYFWCTLDEIPYCVTIDYLAPTMETVVSDKGRDAPNFNPTLTYAETVASRKQFDILWVPAGVGPDFVTGESRIPEEQIQFIAWQVKKANLLAGVLSGKRATTNKLFFRTVVVLGPMARWLIDGNVWTSSGITAGSDMALAFVEHLTSPKVAHHIRGEYEIKEGKERDDPFAAFHGLV